ncbi:hypothetical protein BDZ91DRAFT_212838 [Kalaharituber pfeilii]|nr:hypothetical protein BDZ91DRAFT_212838 [Kalaharituber pfeilii]
MLMPVYLYMQYFELFTLSAAATVPAQRSPAQPAHSTLSVLRRSRMSEISPFHYTYTATYVYDRLLRLPKDSISIQAKVVWTELDTYHSTAQLRPQSCPNAHHLQFIHPFITLWHQLQIQPIKLLSLRPPVNQRITHITHHICKRHTLQSIPAKPQPYYNHRPPVIGQSRPQYRACYFPMHFCIQYIK